MIDKPASELTLEEAQQKLEELEEEQQQLEEEQQQLSRERLELRAVDFLRAKQLPDNLAPLVANESDDIVKARILTIEDTLEALANKKVVQRLSQVSVPKDF